MNKPQNKRLQNEQMIKQDDSSYVSGRKRKFLPTWCEGRPWLKYEESHGTKLCKICQQFAAGNDNVFVKGRNKSTKG